MFKIYGRHSIKAACENKKRKSKTFFGRREVYQRMGLSCSFQTSTEEYLAVEELYVASDLDTILSQRRLILLDSLEDPQNLGSIIRSAAILGYSVLIRKSRGCPINNTVIKCASGGIDKTSVLEIQNLQEILNKLKEHGFWIYGLSEQGSTSFPINEKFMLVIGSEGDGISYLAQKNCDYLLQLRGAKDFNVYNASAAASIAMYHMS